MKTSLKQSSVQNEFTLGVILIHYVLQLTDGDLKILRCSGSFAVAALIVAGFTYNSKAHYFVNVHKPLHCA